MLWPVQSASAAASDENPKFPRALALKRSVSKIGLPIQFYRSRATAASLAPEPSLAVRTASACKQRAPAPPRARPVPRYGIGAGSCRDGTTGPGTKEC
jgi:hypothetical protein